jgi:hypothetical protein
MEFLSITEDALRRIGSGNLNASKKAERKLTRYKVFGYGLLEKNGDQEECKTEPEHKN